MKKQPLGIKRIASIHMFVRDFERTRKHYINSFGFVETAESTCEFEQLHGERASVVEAGKARFVILHPLSSDSEAQRWLDKHPEGVGRIVFEVDDIEHVYSVLGDRQATVTTDVHSHVGDGGRIAWFDIATPIGDTQFRFVQYDGEVPLLPLLKRVPHAELAGSRFNYGDVDHVTSNFLTLQPAIAWMRDVMGFEHLWDIDFHTADLLAEGPHGTGLKSIVMHDPASGIKFANNEARAPNFKASQVYLFCEDNHGPGVQHVALTVDNLLEAVSTTKASGTAYMPVPREYYGKLPDRLRQCGVMDIDEDLDDLASLGILVDGETKGRYLLQTFMVDAATAHDDPEAGPFFFELIQRKGDRGFGGGNFRALFESIETQQQADGRA